MTHDVYTSTADTPPICSRLAAAFTGKGVEHLLGPFPMAFGHGPHFCVGALLTRLESEIRLVPVTYDSKGGPAT